MDARKPRTDQFDALLGARVKGLRKARGLSQSALAESLGITFQQVQKYENGSNRISALALVKLADALGVQVGDLMMEIGVGSQSDTAEAETEKLLAHFQRIRSPELRASVLRIMANLAGR